MSLYEYSWWNWIVILSKRWLHVLEWDVIIGDKNKSGISFLSVLMFLMIFSTAIEVKNLMEKNPQDLGTGKSETRSQILDCFFATVCCEFISLYFDESKQKRKWKCVLTVVCTKFCGVFCILFHHTYPQPSYIKKMSYLQLYPHSFILIENVKIKSM